MRISAVAAALVLTLAASVPAGAQDRSFENEVLRRLERLERRIDALERRDGGGRSGGYDSDYARPAPREPQQRSEVVAATSLLCGASCGMAAQSYCRQTGFAKGVPLDIEKRGAFDHVTRVRCFN